MIINLISITVKQIDSAPVLFIGDQLKRSFMKKKETKVVDLSKAWEKYKEENSAENKNLTDQKVITGFSNINECEVVVYNNRKYFRRKKKAS
jgi:hypothetical protein